ncbi:thioredoxin family protein [Spongiivirga sp. MCCC 1A20706]|uniref:thioredoxin family protein n=1 Tax=Spongiivirga sp. MCCC 1A20706 TaxID=3160963 RepID=UPI003977A81A
MSQFINAQIAWKNDLIEAKKIALQQNKLLLLDFTAVWCAPCRKMDKFLWESKEMEKIDNNFIYVKIDIDHQPHLKKEFEISSIPVVHIIDAAGNRIWSKKSFTKSSDYTKILRQFPSHTLTLSKNLKPILEKRLSSMAFYNLARSYQGLVYKLYDKKISKYFKQISNSFFNQVIEKSNNQHLIVSSKLNILLNEVYCGREKQVRKELSLIEIDIGDDRSANLKKQIEELIASK